MIRLVFTKFLLIIVVLLTISCSKRADYDFIVSNETDYLINSFIIGSGDDKIEISIDPKGTSEIVTYEFGGTYFNFTEPLLAVAVKQYSDSIDTYDYNTGGVISIPDLFDKSSNSIKISLDKESTNSNVIFLLETNK